MKATKIIIGIVLITILMMTTVFALVAYLIPHTENLEPMGFEHLIQESDGSKILVIYESGAEDSYQIFITETELYINGDWIDTTTNRYNTKLKSGTLIKMDTGIISNASTMDFTTVDSETHGPDAYLSKTLSVQDLTGKHTIAYSNYDVLDENGDIVFHKYILPEPEEVSNFLLLNAYKIQAKNRGNVVVGVIYQKNGNRYKEYFEVKYDQFTSTPDMVNYENVTSGNNKYIVISKYFSRMDYNGHIHNVIDEWKSIPLNTFSNFTTGYSKNVEYQILYDTTDAHEEDIENLTIPYVGTQYIDLFYSGKELVPEKLNYIYAAALSHQRIKQEEFTVSFRTRELITIQDIVLSDKVDLKNNTFYVNQDENGYYVGGFDVKTYIARDIAKNFTITLKSQTFHWEVILSAEKEKLPDKLPDGWDTMTVEEKLQFNELELSKNFKEIYNYLKDSLSGVFLIINFIFTGLPLYITAPAGLIFTLVLVDYLRGR